MSIGIHMVKPHMLKILERHQVLINYYKIFYGIFFVHLSKTLTVLFWLSPWIVLHAMWNSSFWQLLSSIGHGCFEICSVTHHMFLLLLIKIFQWEVYCRGSVFYLYFEKKYLYRLVHFEYLFGYRIKIQLPLVPIPTQPNSMNLQLHLFVSWELTWSSV